MASHKQSAQATAAASLGENTLRETGSSVIAYSFTADSRTKIMSFRMGTTAAPTTAGNLVLSVQNPTLGTQYAVTTLSVDMVGSTSVFYTEAMYLEMGDVFKVEYANADSVQYGLTIVYADLGAN